MEVSRLFWVGKVVLPVLWLWHLQTPADIVFWINVHTYVSRRDRSHACSVSSSVHCWLVRGDPGTRKQKSYTPILFSLLKTFWPLQFWATNSDSHINDGFTETKRTPETTMCVSSARERSFEDRFA